MESDLSLCIFIFIFSHQMPITDTCFSDSPSTTSQLGISLSAWCCTVEKQGLWQHSVLSAYSPVAAYVSFNTVLTSPSGQATVWWQDNKCRVSRGVDSGTGLKAVQAHELKLRGRGGNRAESRDEREEEWREGRNKHKGPISEA